ncbi:hypothetical protein KP509_26G050500 [Ceratopteris richardii]|uniref:Probable purine permease n=1 Tax=Ceratopteris richardii TaxID=49495 RepID=A0A8T2RM60_CERRI|nr:hypothetical protein KP509_26G050500 [Ceratopteris richardii]KAH7297041.1 hypothetical protein KP509_26G050500 [Ceratopteris richardii]
MIMHPAYQYALQLFQGLQKELRECWNLCKTKSRGFWATLAFGYIAMLTAFPASSILSRLYYQDGGNRRWLVAWTAVAGWPLTGLALLPFYFKKGVLPTRPTWILLFAYAFIGFLSAADNLMYSWAYSYLPASTASLIASSSLAFTAFFAFCLIGKRMNAFTVNAIGIITAATVILALDSSSDRPTGVSEKQYVVGFVLDLGGSALHGLIFALSEMVFIKLLGRESTHVILEQQTMVSFFGFLFTTIGVVLSGDFSVMKAESQRFKHGPSAYYNVIVWSVISYQVGIVGSVAILYCASTLLAGVLNAVRVPITSIAAVIALHDPMNGFKVLSIVLTAWGFGSYVYGGFKERWAHKVALIVPSARHSDEHIEPAGSFEGDLELPLSNSGK